MPTVLFRSDPRVYKFSASEAAHPLAAWIYDPPSLPSLLGSVLSKHWKLNNADPALATDIAEMTAGEKAAVDAAEAAATLSAEVAGAKAQHDGPSAEMRALRATVKVLVSELNILRTQWRDYQAVVAASGNLNDVKTGTAGLSTLNDRTYAQARTSIGSEIDGE